MILPAHIAGHGLASGWVDCGAAHRADVHTGPAADAHIGVGTHTAVLEPKPGIHGAYLDARGLIAGHADNGHKKLSRIEVQDLDPGQPGIGPIKVLHGACYHTSPAPGAFPGLDTKVLRPGLHKSIALLEVGHGTKEVHYPMKKVV